MKLVIDKSFKICRGCIGHKVETIELEAFRWDKHHKFYYVRLGSCSWCSLEDDEEIVGLTL